MRVYELVEATSKEALVKEGVVSDLHKKLIRYIVNTALPSDTVDKLVEEVNSMNELQLSRLIEQGSDPETSTFSELYRHALAQERKRIWPAYLEISKIPPPIS